MPEIGVPVDVDQPGAISRGECDPRSKQQTAIAAKNQGCPIGIQDAGDSIREASSVRDNGLLVSHLPGSAVRVINISPRNDRSTVECAHFLETTEKVRLSQSFRRFGRTRHAPGFRWPQSQVRGRGDDGDHSLYDASSLRESPQRSPKSPGITGRELAESMVF